MVPNTGLPTASPADSQAFALGTMALETVAPLPEKTRVSVPRRLPRPDVTRVWGTDFAKLDMEGTLAYAQAIIENRVPEFFVTANLHSLMLCEQHPRLHEINQHAAAVLADGQPIVVKSRRQSAPLPARVAGSDLIIRLGELSAAQGYRVFLLGGAPGVADAAATKLKAMHPGLQLAGTMSPPFRSVSSAEHREMLAEIKSTRPDILLVAFGQPKGEFWIYDNMAELEIPLSIQVGASFDFLAGKVKRSPVIWQKLGCEWLHRAWSDPRRLVPRYAANALFLAKLVSRDLSPFAQPQ